MIVRAALAATALGLIGLTAALTASEYRHLPSRVPLHFLIDGRPSTYGPRPAIWLLVVIQLLVLVLVLGMTGPGFAAAPPHLQLRLGIFTVCILAALTSAQFCLIATAKSAEQKLPVAAFLVPLSCFTGVGLLALFYL